MYYLRDGLGKKKGCKWIGSILAVLFCLFTLLASFGIGSMGQVNKIVTNVAQAFDVSALSSIEVFSGVSLYNILLGAAIMVLTALITLGGLKRIANVAEKIVPFMVVLFVAGSLVIIGINYANILPAFKAIFVNAFTLATVDCTAICYQSAVAYADNDRLGIHFVEIAAFNQQAFIIDGINFVFITPGCLLFVPRAPYHKSVCAVINFAVTDCEVIDGISRFCGQTFYHNSGSCNRRTV
jgi:hypothetical protein